MPWGWRRCWVSQYGWQCGSPQWQSVALVVAVAPVVELVDAVAAVAAPVQVAAVSPLHQPDLDPFPMASVLSQVSRVVYRLLRGLYHPVLGLALAQECCLVLGLAPPSAELHLGSPSAESRLAPPAAEFGLDHPSVGSRLAHPTWLPFLLFFPFLGFFGLGSFLGFGVFTCFAFLGFFPGGGPMDPPSPPSGPGAGHFFDYAPRSSSLSGSSSGIEDSSGEIMHLRITIFCSPSSSMGSLSESSSSLYGSMAVWQLKPCFCLKFSINSSIIPSVHFRLTKAAHIPGRMP